VNQIRHVAIVGTRALVCAIRLLREMEVEVDKPDRSRRCQEGRRLEVGRWSPVGIVGLYRYDSVIIVDEGRDEYSLP
jgi:hypothetical protein